MRDNTSLRSVGSAWLRSAVLVLTVAALMVAAPQPAAADGAGTCGQVITFTCDSDDCAPIRIDGSFNDWTPLLASNRNVILDTLMGYPVGDPLREQDSYTSTDQDLRRFAWTSDQRYIYVYFERKLHTAGNREVDFMVYFDRNADGKLSSGDKILNVTWQGNQGTYDSYFYTYQQANAGGDDLTGDGVDEPGGGVWGSPKNDGLPWSIHLENDTFGGDTNGMIRVEARMPWWVLEPDPGNPVNTGPRPIRFHVSSGRGTESIPNQIDDNMGPGDTRCAGVTLTPDNTGATSQGTTLSYTHTLTNTGNYADTYTLSTSGTLPGWTASWSPITATVAAGQSTPVTVSITVPTGVADGVLDTTVVKATSSLDSAVYAQATDKTATGRVIVAPDQRKYGEPTQTLSYEFRVYNKQPFADTLNLTNSSTLGWSYALSKDGSPVTSVALGANGSTLVQLQVTIPPGAAVGATDVNTLTAVSQLSGRVRDSAAATTVAAGRITLVQDQFGIFGPHTTAFYYHTVTNNYYQPLTVNLTAVSELHNVPGSNPPQTAPWTTRIYDAETYQQITSVNLAAFGGSKRILVQMDVPSGTPDNTLDHLTVTATTGSWTVFNTDTTEVHKIIVYKDPARTIPATVLHLGDTGYARATDLVPEHNYYITFEDARPNARLNPVKVSPALPADLLGIVDFDYVTSLASDVPSNGDPEVQWRSALKDVDLVGVPGYDASSKYFYYVRAEDHLKMIPSVTQVAAGAPVTLTVQVVDILSRPVPLATNIRVSVNGNAVFTASSLAYVQGVQTQHLTGLTSSDGSARVTIYNTRAEMVVVTPHAVPPTPLLGSYVHDTPLPPVLVDRDEPAVLTVVPAEPYGITVVSGQGVVPPSVTLGNIVVRVVDPYLNSLAAEETVSFQLSSYPAGGDGKLQLSATQTTTIPGTGLATVNYTFDPNAPDGRYTVVAENPSLPGGYTTVVVSRATLVPGCQDPSDPSSCDPNNPGWRFDTGRRLGIWASPVIPGTDPDYGIPEESAYIGQDGWENPNGTVYDGGWVYAIYAASQPTWSIMKGTKKWEWSLTEDSPSRVGGHVRSYFEVMWVTSLDKYLVYFTATNGHIYAMNLNGTCAPSDPGCANPKGILQWEADLSKGAAVRQLSAPIPSQYPVLFSGKGERQPLYVGSADGYVYALDAVTGEELARSPQFGGPVLSSPAIMGDYMWVGSDDGTISLLSLNTLTVRWSVQTGAPVRSQVFLAIDYTKAVVASTNGDVYAFEPYNGQQAPGFTVTHLGVPIYTSPWYAFDPFTGESKGFYLTGDNHTIYRFDNSGNLVTSWPYVLNSGTQVPQMRSSPLVMEDASGMPYVYEGGMDELFYVTKGNSPTTNFLNVYDTLADPYQGGFYSSPGTNGIIAVLGGLNGYVYAIPMFR